MQNSPMTIEYINIFFPADFNCKTQCKLRKPTPDNIS